MSSIITEQEATALIERELSLQEIATRGPQMYATIFRGLQRIRHIDPEKAEGRRAYVLTHDLSKARLSMPQEIQSTVYTLQEYKSFSDFCRGMFSTAFATLGFSGSLALAAQNHTDNTSLYVVAGFLGLSAAVLQIKGTVHLVNSFRNVCRQKSDERFARPLDSRESKLVDYIFMNDRPSPESTREILV